MTKAEWTAYMRKYAKMKYIHLGVMLRKGRDDDIIEFLYGVENKCEYVRELIRKDIREIEEADDEGDSVPELRQGV